MKKRTFLLLSKFHHVLWFCTCTLLVNVITTQTVEAKTINEKHKTITKEIEVNASTVLNVEHDHGDIKIEEYEGSVAKVVVDVTVRADEGVNLDEIINKYKLEIQNRKDKIEVKSTFGIKSWVINSGSWFSRAKHYIEFKDGTRINAKITDLEAELTLYIPKIKKLELDHKHHNIFGGDIHYDMKVNLRGGELDLGHIHGNLELNLKHGSGEFGNVTDASIDIFDSNLKLEKGRDILLKSKHSNLDLINAESIKIDLFDSELKLNSVKSTLEGTEKHSRIFVDSIGQGNLELFDSKVNILKSDNLNIKGKHGVYQLGEIGTLTTKLFDCTLSIDQVSTLNGTKSEHSTFHIENLIKDLTVPEAFDNHIEVDKTNSTFTGLNVNGEHTTIKIDLLECIDYQVDVDVEYGDIDLNTDDFNLIKHIEKNSHLTLLGKKNGALETAPLIKIRGKVMKLDIER